MYIVAMGKDGDKYEGLKGQYESAVSAIDVADSRQGYKVYRDGVIFYQQETSNKTITRRKSRVCQTAKGMIARMKELGKLGRWIYSNSGCSGTFDDAISKQNYKSNCATLANWIYRQLRITKAGMYFYGKAGSIIQWRNDETKAAVNERCHVFPVGLTVAQALAEGTLQPGDICLYAKQHTNVYAGNGKWYESGTVYADGSGKEGTKLTKFYGPTVISDWVISWVIRYNDIDYVPIDREYRVQCGSFSQKQNANNLKKRLKAKNIPAIVIKVGNQYIVQTGKFKVSGNATRFAEQLQMMNFPVLIKGV